MKNLIRNYLEKIRKLKRKEHHIILHHVHKRYNISRKTLFYIKEYGDKTNATKTILKESIKILLLASIISSFGGLAIENIKLIFVSIIPLIILLPALNDMLGDYGTIVSSKVSTMLHLGKIKNNFLKNKSIMQLFKKIMIIALTMGLFSSIMSLIISKASNYYINIDLVLKIISIVLIDIVILVTILFLIAVIAGLYFYKKKEDPNNFLIPITTSIADFGNMIILTVLVLLFF
jgi:mgtE-like transporter